MAVKEVSSYQCTVCSKLYPDRKMAEKCFRRCLRIRRERRKRNKLHAERERLRDYVRLHARTYDEIWDLLVKEAKKNLGLAVVFDEVPDRFSERVSNTHRCPVGGVTNWGSRSNFPRGYPGWEGDFVGAVSGKAGVDLSALFDGRSFDCELPYGFRGFHTGTGCPGSRFRISGYIFLDDFPKVKEWWLSCRVANRLAGKRLFKK